MESHDLKRTSLFGIYERYGARLVPFGGWEMPVQFSGVIDEHLTVRKDAGLFDVSHMGEIWIEGREALDVVQHMTINDASRLDIGAVQYSAMANSEGGLVDDLTVYRAGAQRFMLCVNASNTERDFRWIEAQIEGFPGAKVVDASGETALIALQGPKAQKILESTTYTNLDELPYYHFIQGKVAGIETMISRTGYTGEDGFELFAPAERGEDLWEEIMAVGEAEGLKSIGLGARDTLRLEMGYALYGNDIDETTTPLEARLGWITKLSKENFIGRDVILRQKEEGVEITLAAFRMEERGIPRSGYGILRDGRKIGRVTSGTMSPSLKVGIGLGYLPPEMASPGTEIMVDIRNRPVKAVVVELPFYKEGSIRKKK